MHNFTQKSKSSSITPTHILVKPISSADAMATLQRRSAICRNPADLSRVKEGMQAYFQRKLSPQAKQPDNLAENIHNHTPNHPSLVPQVQANSLAESDVQESPSSVQMKESGHPDNLQHDDDELQGKQADTKATWADYLQQDPFPFSSTLSRLNRKSQQHYPI